MVSFFEFIKTELFPDNIDCLRMLHLLKSDVNISYFNLKLIGFKLFCFKLYLHPNLFIAFISLLILSYLMYLTNLYFRFSRHINVKLFD